MHTCAHTHKHGRAHRYMDTNTHTHKRIGIHTHAACTCTCDAHPTDAPSAHKGAHTQVQKFSRHKMFSKHKRQVCPLHIEAWEITTGGLKTRPILYLDTSPTPTSLFCIFNHIKLRPSVLVPFSSCNQRKSGVSFLHLGFWGLLLWWWDGVGRVLWFPVYPQALRSNPTQSSWALA